MKANKKALALVLCALMLVAASVFGTQAYLTDTDAVKNTFTVGHVDILLDEAEVNDKGEKISENRVVENDYHLVPGHSYVKDPTVTVIGGSDEAYVRMMVTVENIEGLKKAMPGYVDTNGVFLIEELCEGWNPAIWVHYPTDAAENGVYEFRYYKTVGTWGGVDEEGKKTLDTHLEPLFTSISLPGALINNAEMDLIKGVKINVTAHAIQADGFVDGEGNPDADAAWDAFAAQVNHEYPVETTAVNPEDGKNVDNG